ncbi:asparagine synthase-related protein [Ornithinimicrobium sp. CNJ-824]|uniref:asparagine synthase-related protein n=1 Tax=Ornithinimicrobium sp. CNJ-824 TaxID=1904966 RepID=UPI00406CE453
MAHSVEGRFPFLDPTVVDFAASLPARHKLFGLEEKFILKHAFADLVPPEILARPKQPYRRPMRPASSPARSPNGCPR